MTAVERVAGAPVLRERARLPSEPARARYVAVRARFTRGAIYGHFRNKSERFVSMTNRVMLPMEMLVSASASCLRLRVQISRFAMQLGIKPLLLSGCIDLNGCHAVDQP
jgi:AcrR family transcriptional regulator